MKAHHWDTDAPSVVDLIREGFGGLIAPLRRLWFVVSGERAVILTKIALEESRLTFFENLRRDVSKKYVRARQNKKASGHFLAAMTHLTTDILATERSVNRLRSQLQSYGEG